VGVRWGATGQCPASSVAMAAQRNQGCLPGRPAGCAPRDRRLGCGAPVPHHRLAAVLGVQVPHLDLLVLAGADQAAPPPLHKHHVRHLPAVAPQAEQARLRAHIPHHHIGVLGAGGQQRAAAREAQRRHLPAVARQRGGALAAAQVPQPHRAVGVAHRHLVGGGGGRNLGHLPRSSPRLGGRRRQPLDLRRRGRGNKWNPSSGRRGPSTGLPSFAKRSKAAGQRAAAHHHRLLHVPHQHVLQRRGEQVAPAVVIAHVASGAGNHSPGARKLVAQVRFHHRAAAPAAAACRQQRGRVSAPGQRACFTTVNPQ
jgi:hypothetical protein